MLAITCFKNDNNYNCPKRLTITVFHNVRNCASQKMLAIITYVKVSNNVRTCSQMLTNIFLKMLAIKVFEDVSKHRLQNC